MPGSDIPIVFVSALPPPTPPVPISGSVADVKGQEALATVTGWLVVYSDFALRYTVIPA